MKEFLSYPYKDFPQSDDIKNTEIIIYKNHQVDIFLYLIYLQNLTIKFIIKCVYI
jgi:hypothetical protein